MLTEVLEAVPVDVATTADDSRRLASRATRVVRSVLAALALHTALLVGVFAAPIVRG